MLTEQDKEFILNEFPNIKLSYEKIIHNKVYPLKDDYLLVIPEGKKCFAWFTTFNDRPVCFILELDNKNKKEIKNIKVMNCCFSNSLSYGTILYGTLFYHLNNNFFSIEDIYLYKGQDISNLYFNSKLNKFVNILKNDIKQISYNNYFVIFGLPIISKSYEDLDRKITEIKYRINSINYTNKKNSTLLLSFHKYKSNEKMEEVKRVEEVKRIEEVKRTEEPKRIERNNIRQSKIFICKPDIQNDIYHLYSLIDEYIGLACIPDYKTSIMMNKLFRKIKENDDLDKLEESDDEEEFENSNLDKFVYLDNSFKMLCNYNNKFKKWTPIKLAD
jgi:hypothetical protein